MRVHWVEEVQLCFVVEVKLRKYGEKKLKSKMTMDQWIQGGRGRNVVKFK